MSSSRRGRPSKTNFAEDIKHLPAKGLARLVQLLKQYPVDLALAGFVCHQVPQVTHLGLPNAVNAAKALLDAVGVPGEIVIDHQVRPLQVDSFPSGIRGNEDLHLRVVPEGLLHVHPLFATHAAVNTHHRFPPPQQRSYTLLEVGERIAVLSKDNQFLVG